MMHPLIASDFGSIAMAELLVGAFCMALPLAILGLTVALIARRAQFAKVLVWLSLAASSLAFISSIFFLSQMRGPDWVFGLGITSIPVALSGAGVYLSNRKRNEN